MVDPIGHIQFTRRIGFGLGVNESAPRDPLDWAIDQVSKVQPLFYQGKLPKLSEGGKALRVYRGKLAKIEKTFGKIPVQFARKKAELNLRTRWSRIGWEYHARGYAAAFGPSPVFERLWHFWCNHFTVSCLGNQLDFIVGPYYRGTIRSKLGGSFNDLVYAATVHPAMLAYLDNNTSIGPNSPFAKKISKRPKKKVDARGLNENHARELLELHTVSSTAGYSQKDVIELALIMTGWYKGKFIKARHEPGARNFLGNSYKNRGSKTLKSVIRDISDLPQTANFLSRKLATAFVADVPPEAAIEHIVAAWNASGGNLPKVHQALFEAVHRWGGSHSKFLTPETWFIQCARILNSPVFVQPKDTLYVGKAHWWLRGWYQELGQDIFFASQPNGWSNLKDDWISPEMIDRRIRFGILFLRALKQSGRLQRGYLLDVIERNWPDQGNEVRQLFSGGNPIDRFQRLAASPFMLRC